MIIASGDMDTLQLIDGKKVQVFTLKKGLNDTVLYDEKAVKERFGFGPELIPDYKGLRGDPSDNIPGIAGIGEKTATILITKFGGIKDIYKALKKNVGAFKEAGLTDRIIKLLEEGEEEAEFSKTLAEIIKDVKIKFSFPEKHWQDGLDVKRAEKAMQKLEFKSLITRLRNVLSEAGREIEEEEKKEIDVSPEELKKLSVAVWLLDSEKTNPDLEEILDFAKTEDLESAKKHIWNELQKKKLDKVYREIEEPLIPIIQEMHENGIKVDKNYLNDLSKKYHKELDLIEKEIFKLAGQEFNVKSPKQLSEILFEKLKLPTKGVKKSAGGSYSTQITVLEKLIGEHSIIEKIIDYRELQKLLSTYIDVIPDMVAEDGRLHPEFIQNGTTTGRFSSNNPNVQNIPTKSDLGRAIRGGFVAEKGSKLVSFDYSQIEFRLAAIFSGDEYLIKAFQEGQDIHAAVASKVFGVSMEEVTKEMRRHAKVINFGILYGMGVNALKKNLGSTQKEAAQFYEDYFNRFKKINDYLEETKAFAKAHGYTETLFGRRRYFNSINSSIPFIQKMAERAAINAPLQGTTADIIKLAMRFVHEEIQKEGLKKDVRMLLQIHDEIIFEIKDDLVEEMTKKLKTIMENVFSDSYINYKSDVPLVVNFSAGNSWQEL